MIDNTQFKHPYIPHGTIIPYTHLLLSQFGYDWQYSNSASSPRIYHPLHLTDALQLPQVDLSYNHQILRMNRLFGAAKKDEPAPPKKQEPQPPEAPPKKTTVPLSEQQAKLENKVRQLSETVTRLDAQAKDLLQKSKKAKGSAKEMYKQRCVNVLRKRKQYDTQLKNYMNQQFTLDQVGFTSESIQNTIEMAATMKEVVEQQKNVMGDLDIDKLDDLRDEMDELKYESDYMNEMLNRNYDCDIDEDDLDDQLGELEQELKAEKQIQKKKEVNPQQQQNNVL